MIKQYLQMCKFYANDGTKPFVFINTSGFHMTQSNIASAMTTAFNKSGYMKRVDCMKIRKFIVTENRKLNPEMRTILAKHMLHKERTANNYYVVYEKSSNTSNCTDTLRQNIDNHVRKLQTRELSAGGDSSEDQNNPS